MKKPKLRFATWFASCALTALSCLFTPAALSHPHEFVTLKMAALFDGDGKIAGLRYNWLFDEFFTAYAVEGQDKNKNGTAEQEELDSLLKEVLGNIHNINYFTKFAEGSVIPQLKNAVPINASMKGRQLDVTFEVSFETPVSVKEKPLIYGVYDDEFYIAMQHADLKNALTLVNAPAGCKWDLQAPNPGDDIVAFADSLDKTQSGGPDLGTNFAEWVTISCK